MLSGSRTINNCRYPLHFQTGLSYCTQNVVILCNYSTMFRDLKQALHRPSPFFGRLPKSSSFPAKRFDLCSDTRCRTTSTSDVGVPLVCGVQPSQSPQVSTSFSEHEEAQEAPSERLSALAGGIVALGKFDALHIGHRELAVQASKIGIPFLLSFAGMAEVLGWEPRAPIVATCDRQRVLFSWAPYCGNLTPKEFQIEFSKVRSLNPRQFVEKLSLELGVHGVVAGENYRFGYRASGSASDLVRLCEEYGMRAHIITSVMDKNQERNKTTTSDTDPKERGQVSSTRVRQALAQGDMQYVAQLLGRPHRLVLSMITKTTNTEQEKEKFIISDNGGDRLSAPKSSALNLPPGEGLYEKCSLIVGDKIVGPCRTVIDSTRIHLELDKFATTTSDFSFQQDFELLGIEFGEE